MQFDSARSMMMLDLMGLGLGLDNTPPRPWPTLRHPESVSKLVRAIQTFEGKLYLELAKSQGPEENLILSGCSVFSVLCMLYLGSKNNTSRLMQQRLSLPLDNNSGECDLEGFKDLVRVLVSDDDFILEQASSIYCHEAYGLQENFEAKVRQIFGATPQTLDFRSDSARELINRDISSVTRNKISELFPPGSLSLSAKIVLANALYFKGDWDQKFNPLCTAKARFEVSPGRTVEVNMMYKALKVKHSGLSELNCEAVELPYKNKRLSMIFFLPDNPFGFQHMETKLMSGFDVSSLELRSETRIDLFVPKFKIRTNHDVTGALKGLGLGDLFIQGSSDFGKLTQSSCTSVSGMRQEACIEVNEEGSEAAAATGVIMTDGISSDRPEFRLDRPFVFMIKDNLTKLILFQGRVMNPANDS